MKANLDGSLQNPNKAAHFAKATAELRFSFESGFAGPVHGEHWSHLALLTCIPIRRAGGLVRNLCYQEVIVGDVKI